MTHVRIIETLLEAYLESVKMQEMDGKLLFHLGCGSEACLTAIEILLKGYPKAAKMQDWHGFSPLDHAANNSHHSDVLSGLLQAYPKAVEVQNRHGDLPLHLACRLKASHFIQLLVDKLFNAYPKATEVPNNYGDLPLHTALANPFFAEFLFGNLFLVYTKAAKISKIMVTFQSI
jgi:ankyrin repeat protein